MSSFPRRRGARPGILRVTAAGRGDDPQGRCRCRERLLASRIPPGYICLSPAPRVIPERWLWHGECATSVDRGGDFCVDLGAGSRWTPFPVSADVRDVDQAIPNVRIIARGASALFDGTQYFLAGGADITLLHTIATASTTAVYRARVRALLTGAHHAISDGRFLAQQDGALISGA